MVLMSFFIHIIQRVDYSTQVSFVNNLHIIERLLCQGIRQSVLIHVYEPEGMVNRMADGKRDMITLVYATHPLVSHSKVRILREIRTNQVNHIWAS
jgi:hypothetical protein